MGDSWIEGLFCGRVIKARDGYLLDTQNGNQQIAELQVELQNLIAEKNNIISSASTSKQQDLMKIDELSQKISDLQDDINDLTIQLNQNMQTDPAHSAQFGNLPQSTQTLLLTYLTKYPEAYITYGGRFFGTNKNRYNLDVKAWLMEGQNDWEIVSMVKNAKARVSDVLAEKPTLSFHQACDIAFMRLTHALGDSISYTYDQNSWGENEFWQFASESRVMTTGDCEDKAILNYIGARIAGIPWEMLRITAGLTYSGEGHCTNFYYASDLKWHHRNSTTNYPADKTASSLPVPGDSTESLNIKNPWFSATETKTFNWFGTEAQKKEAMALQDQPFFKFLTIIKR